jgi:hypothetical protein
MIKSELSERVISECRKRRIFTVSDLKKLLGCSRATVVRRIKEWDAHTSYNLNGKFYSLPKVPQFDGHGLWQYKGAFFSKHGNLKDSIRHFVCRSQSGLSTLELGKQLGLPPHTIQSVLSASRDQMSLRRQQLNGLNIYFSDGSEVYHAQLSARQNLLQQSAKLDIPNDADAIAIFVDLIKHPKDRLELLVRRVRRQGVKVSIEGVRNLLTYHGIVKKKPRFSANKRFESSPRSSC